jgi:hypothetical protein
MPTRSPAQRQTEGTRAGAVSRGDRGNRGRGRPPGSKNKPKGLIPLPLAEDIIKSLQPVLPPEQLRYLRSVVKDGAALDTRKELDTLILLLNRSIWPALVSEAVPYDTTDLGTAVADGEDEDEDGEPVGEKRPPTTILRKDVTDRLKVLNSLLNLRASLDKREDEAESPNEQPILRIFADRSVADRVGVLVGYQPGGVSGDADRTERLALPVGAVPNPPAERPEPVPVGEQE